MYGEHQHNAIEHGLDNAGVLFNHETTQKLPNTYNFLSLICLFTFMNITDNYYYNYTIVIGGCS